MNSYQATTTNNDAIRKAAILVSALDMDAADTLLEQMPDDFASAVRAAVMELDTIEDHEEQHVIGQFLGNVPSLSQVDDELTLGHDIAANGVTLEDFLLQQDEDISAPLATETISETATVGASIPFESLQDAHSDELSRVLQNEHPQAVALVLSHVGAEQAAAVMERLPLPMQVDVARRMVGLEEVDAETLTEIEHGLRHLLGVSQRTRESRGGFKAMREILSETSSGGALLQNLQRADVELARQLTSDAAVSTLTSDAAVSTLTSDAAVSTLPSDKHAQPVVSRSHVSRSPMEFSTLVDLSDADLGRVLQHAEGRVLLLALAGASIQLIDKIYRQLPRADAETLRRQIEQQGPIRLRDVEEAQRRIGLTADRLADNGEINTPTALSKRPN